MRGCQLQDAGQGLPSTVQSLAADKTPYQCDNPSSPSQQKNRSCRTDTKFSMVGIGVMKYTYIYICVRPARLQTITCDAKEELTVGSNAWKPVLDNERVVRLRPAKVPALLAEGTLLLCCNHQVLIPHALCCEPMNGEGACTMFLTPQYSRTAMMMS